MPTIDYRELIRFVLTGGVATLANLVGVWIGRIYLPFSASLICGIVAGIAVSFFMTKLFAFRSHDWSRTRGEAVRFLIVYGAGLLGYYAVAVVVFKALASADTAPLLAETIGVLCGGAFMAGSSYFGHKLFTYRTPRSGDNV